MIECQKKTGTEIGILAVPIEHAQEAADAMISSGLKAIWNFTPLRIRVPDNIVVQNTSLYAHLSLMFNRLDSQQAESGRKDKE
jgi:redox-sensing transcriptional repressor